MRWLVVLLPLLTLAEPLTHSKIVSLLGQQNPFVLLRSIELLKSQAKRLDKEAPYDLKLLAKYEKKEYPLSRSLYVETGASKLLQRGVEVALKWRKAKGVQEYNNIKTGQDGEYLLQIKLDLISLLEGMSAVDIQKRVATLEVMRQKKIASEKINRLYFDVLSLFNEAIFYKKSVAIIRKRLQKVEQIVKLVERKFQEGVLSHQDLLQTQEWELQQRQALVRTEAALANAKRMLRLFLGVEVELPKTFEQRGVPPLSRAIDYALAKRASIQELAIKKRQFEYAEKEAKLQRFGKLEASLYGAYDVAYEKEGAKGVVGLQLPLQRSGYKAKRQLATIAQLAAKTELALLRQTIETKLRNLYTDLEKLEKERAIVAQRVELLKRIAELEYQKLQEGIGDTFSLNQKLMQSYMVDQTLLELEKSEVLKRLEVELEMGRIGRD